MAINAQTQTHPSAGRGTEAAAGGGHTRVAWLRRGVIGVAGWLVAVTALSLLWQYGFDFETADAWALAVGIASMVTMLIVLMLVVNYGINLDSERMTGGTPNAH